MNTIKHGSVLPLDTSDLESKLVNHDGKLPKSCFPSWPFGYMFPELQNDQRLSEKSPDTEKNLRWLGEEGMEDTYEAKAPSVPIPTIYTFFGQFVDHDITFERGSSEISLKDPTPINPADLA